MKRVAIDLTPLIPGGDNGGAKPLALMLVRHLAAAAPECEFVLLTQEKTHTELAALDAPNVRRVCTTKPANAPAVSRRSALRLRQMLLKLLPAAAVERLGRIYLERFEQAPAGNPLLREIGAELLFCPFTGVLFYDAGVPVVSLVHDLQYRYYPEFFDPADRHERDRHFRQVCRVASRIVCVSEFTRSTVLAQGGVAAERVVTVLSAVERGWGIGDGGSGCEAARGARGRYLLYPANFWRHKNHEMLLAAFGMYRARHSRSDLKLVLTGAPSPRRDELMEAASRMGLAEWVEFPGHLLEAEFAALLEGCAAMIFPSLFEGFGLPVLEAMAAGVPVLAGNLTSLPEIAGDAALLFDPRRPTEIVEAIERSESDAALVAELVARGRDRAHGFAGPEQMAARYLAVFEEAARNPLESAPALYGVFADGWTGGRVQVVFGRGSGPRRLVVKLRAPEWIPAAAVTVRVTPGGGKRRVARGEECAIGCELPESAGTVELLCSPVFQPGGADRRSLGCMLLSASIVQADGGVQELKQADAA